MMYASKIDIKREPQKVRYQREIRLSSGLLTIEDITKHLKEGEQFGFRTLNEGIFEDCTVMDIVGYRLETDKELAERITKQEQYNENYEKHKAKYAKK